MNQPNLVSHELAFDPNIARALESRLANMQKFDRTLDENLVIAFVAPTGSKVKDAYRQLELHLDKFGYTCCHVKLSRLLADRSLHLLGQEADHHGIWRVWDLMNAGNRARMLAEDGGALIALAVEQIWNDRGAAPGREAPPPKEKRVYIIDSLKHPAEISLLREIYGSGCLVVSVFSPAAQRLEEIMRRVAPDESRHDSMRDLKKLDVGKYYNQARFLLARDESEDQWARDARNVALAEDWGIIDEKQRAIISKKFPDSASWAEAEIAVSKDFGQDVEGSFPQADVFLDATNAGLLDAQVERLVRLLVGDQFITPNPAEQGMAIANISRFRSSDPGRQVGVAITSQDGTILSTGTNEVPRAGGGQYWPPRTSTDPDNRDFELTHSLPRRHMEDGVVEVLTRLQAANRFDGDEFQPLLDAVSSADGNWREGEALAATVAEAMDVLKGTRITSLIEFFRSTHAEMAAILACNAGGQSTTGAVMYGTTFPCHECMKHILHAGIAEVQYIEAYPKSLGRQLHEDDICEDPGHRIGLPCDCTDRQNCLQHACSRLHLVPFTGIGPRRYGEYFHPTDRKAKVGDRFNKYREGEARIRSKMKAAKVFNMEAYVLSMFRFQKTKQDRLGEVE